jgi:hypothetical protein
MNDFFFQLHVLTHVFFAPRLQKPQKLRHMLEQHAPLGRLYLAPEGENRSRHE